MVGGGEQGKRHDGAVGRNRGAPPPPGGQPHGAARRPAVVAGARGRAGRRRRERRLRGAYSALGGAAALRAAAEFSKEEAAKFKEGKTAVVKNSLNPRWDEACELVMPTAISTSGDARVELTMFDW